MLRRVFVIGLHDRNAGSRCALAAPGVAPLVASAAMSIRAALAMSVFGMGALHAQASSVHLITKLEPSGIAFGDSYGSSIALRGSRGVLGSDGDDTGAGSDAGSAYVAERQLDGSWAHVAKLRAADAAAGDHFGAAVSLSGARVLVGAPMRDSAAGADAGAAYVFERQADGTWVEVAKLSAGDAAASDRFGNSVALDGDIALVGARKCDLPLLVDAGAAYVFERQADGAWALAAKLVAATPHVKDEFGGSVSLSGTRALVGAWEFQAGPGAAYVFDRGASGTWSQSAKLTASDGQGSDTFGTVVAIEGDRAIATAPLDTTTVIGAGSAYVFDRTASGAWTQSAKLLASDAFSDDWFGQAVGLSGDRALIGAATTHVLGFGPGASYLYERHSDGTWHESAIIAPSDVSPGAHFGWTSDIDRDRLLIGASGKKQAYVYRVCEACLSTFGAGTPGCTGLHSLSATSAAESGLASFALICTAAQPSSAGFLALADAADAAGSDPLGFGIALHIDLHASSFLLVQAFACDAAGVAKKALSIPSDPTLVGLEFVAQAVWPWTSCALPPSQLSSSNGLAFTILAP